ISPAARKERAWTVLRLAVSGGRGTRRREEKGRSLTKIYVNGTMKKNWCCKNVHVPPHVLTGLALSRYHFSTPEIRLLMKQILGYALSGRTIKGLAKSA